MCSRELAEIEHRRQRYLGDRERVDVAGRTAIIVDDGIATGATMRAALRATRQRSPARLVLAVPVAPTDTIAAMRQEADDVVCLEDYDTFGAIGLYYSDFCQISDEEVVEIPPIAFHREISAAAHTGGVNHIGLNIVARDGIADHPGTVRCKMPRVHC